MRRARLLLLLLTVTVIGSALPARAAADSAIAPRRLFEQSRAGVGLVTAEFSADLTLPQPGVNSANTRALNALLTQRVQRGEILPTVQALNEAWFAELARDPFRWLTPTGKSFRPLVKLILSGSGFAVTPDGHVVTNAHVVAPKSLRTVLVYAELSSKDYQPFRNSSALAGMPASLRQSWWAANERWFAKHATVSHLSKNYAVMGSSGSGVAEPLRHTAKLVLASSQLPGKDLAVLKVDAHNMGTVPIGDDSALSTGDRLFVLGFPGPATYNPLLSQNSQKEPTLTQGVLSAKKTVSQGFTVLQTDAAMTHGNSGGPVFDDQGRVVGVATFGSVDLQTGQEVSGFNFAVPASVVREFLAKAHVTPTEGLTTHKFDLALDAYDKHWYKRALPLFNAVKQLDPGHPLVSQFIRDSQTAIKQGRDRTPRELLGLPIALFATLAAVAGVLVLALPLRLRRSRRRRAKARRLPPTPFLPPSTATVASLPPSFWSPPSNGNAPHPVTAELRPPAPPIPSDPVRPTQPLPPSAAPTPSEFFQPGANHRFGPPPLPSSACTCPSCGHHSPPTARFCENCWYDLKTPGPGSQ